MKITKFKTDKSLELNGVWHIIDANDPKRIARVLVARDNNPKFVSKVRTALAPYQAKILRDSMTVDQSDDLMAKIMAETILLGWENIDDDDGKPITYNTENAYKLLLIPDFRAVITSLSTQMDSYRSDKIAEVTEDLKKL